MRPGDAERGAFDTFWPCGTAGAWAAAACVRLVAWDAPPVASGRLAFASYSRCATGGNSFTVGNLGVSPRASCGRRAAPRIRSLQAPTPRPPRLAPRPAWAEADGQTSRPDVASGTRLLASRWCPTCTSAPPTSARAASRCSGRRARRGLRHSDGARRRRRGRGDLEAGAPLETSGADRQPRPTAGQSFDPSAVWDMGGREISSRGRARHRRGCASLSGALSSQTQGSRVPRPRSRLGSDPCPLHASE